MVYRRYDPVVITGLAAFMQRLADYVRRGFREFVLGEVRLERAVALASRFARLYQVGLHRNQRYRNRAVGEGTACVLWCRPSTDTLLFALLLTPGPHAARNLERLSDVGQGPGRMTLGDYELVQRPRPGQSRVSWTWRIRAEAYEAWRARVLLVVRSGSAFEVDAAIDDLRRLPGFAAIREQAKRLRALLKSEWRRRRASHPMPTLPRQPYVQRLSNRGVVLSVLCRRALLERAAGDRAEVERSNRPSDPAQSIPGSVTRSAVEFVNEEAT
jgi:hypothetical protein